MKLNFQKLDIEIPVEIPVNFMILTGTGIPANRLILTGTGILPGSRSILVQQFSHLPAIDKVYYYNYASLVMFIIECIDFYLYSSEISNILLSCFRGIYVSFYNFN